MLFNFGILFNTQFQCTERFPPVVAFRAFCRRQECCGAVAALLANVSTGCRLTASTLLPVMEEALVPLVQAVSAEIVARLGWW